MSQSIKVIAKTQNSVTSLNLLPVKNEAELQEMTKDELKSVAAHANAMIADLQKSAPDSLFAIMASKMMAALPNDLDQMALLDLQAYLVTLLKLSESSNVAVLEDVSAQDLSGLGSELNNIDFYKMIAGPLNAVVQAQGTAAMTTIAFIKDIGFDKDANGNITGIRKVEFMYEKKTGEKNEDGSDVVVNTKITVPILAMVNVPSLRIQDVDIAFNAKINGVEELKDESVFKVGAELGITYGPVNFKASASYQRTSTSGIKVEREYTMAVKVKATQDEIPAGLEKILNLLAA